jgi:predicted oxidoreductase
MKNVYLSDSGPKVSEAIYGFWRWKDQGNDTIIKIEKVVNLCLEHGINTFDHADSYGGFSIEKYFGEVLRRRSFKRQDVVLFSKCGIRVSDKGFTFYDTSAEHILSSVNNSLQRLQTDYLDVFLLHHIDHLSDLESTAKALMQLVKQGKIKSVGVSNFSVFQHQQLASYLSVPIVTNHVELNLLNISAIEDGRIDFIKQRYSKPLAWAPLADGRILNGLDPKSELMRSKLMEIGAKHGANVEQTAVAWLMQLGTLPIIGSLNEERIKNAATAADIRLSNEDWYELFQIAQLG